MSETKNSLLKTVQRINLLEQEELESLGQQVDSEGAIEVSEKHGLFTKIKAVFLKKKKSNIKFNTNGQNGQSLSRRDFIKYGLAAAATLVTPTLNPEANKVKAHSYENGSGSALSGERERLQKLPTDIRGNEEYLGNDIMLTIDDCHLFNQTKEMFDMLQERGFKATFFPNTDFLSLDDPEVVNLWREIYRAGFEIGYHTTNHNQEWSVAELEEDLAKFTNHMKVLLDDEDFHIQFVRPPYGNWNHSWMTWVTNNNLTNVRWNFVPNSNNKSVEYYEAVRNHPEGGKIILLHPRQWDVGWLEIHIDELESLAEEESGRITTLNR